MNGNDKLNETADGIGRMVVTRFVDGFRVYLADSAGDVFEPPKGWDAELFGVNRLAVHPARNDLIAFSTERNIGSPVSVRIRPTAPQGSADDWDHIVEASMSLTSGGLLVADSPNRSRTGDEVPVAPGSYRARIHTQGLATIADDGLIGNERYHVDLWPAEISPARLLKRWLPRWGEE